MADYITRSYRDHFRRDRRTYFVAGYKETDLCIGVDKDSWQPGMAEFAGQYIRGLRAEIDRKSVV